MNDLSEFVVLNDTTLTTDSRRVAKHFKKAHKNVLRAFDRLATNDDEFNRLNFEPVEEVDEKGESRRVIRMTKNGFALLVMGFTGPEATRIKIAYIRAFDAMSDQLQRIGHNLWKQYMDLEKRDATSFMWASFGAKRMVERKRDKPLLENERELLEAELQPTLFNEAKGILQ